MIRLRDLILENDSQATKQAKSQGLVSMGFGRWGKDGVVTHTTQNGTLQPVKKDKSTDTKVSNTISSADTKSSTTAQQTDTSTQQSTTPQNKDFSVQGEKDGGTLSSEEFTSSFPEFGERNEEIADEDEEVSKKSIYGVDNWEEVVETLEKWKWGGEEGKGAWGFDADERQRIFDTINRNIRETNATVSTPVLHRGVSFVNNEAAQTLIQQFVPGQSIELPPCGWAPDASTALQYGPDDPSEPEVAMMVELRAGNSPIRGLATTAIERNMGMDVQREVITPGDVKYKVVEVKKYTVTRGGRTQTVYKAVLEQEDYTNEVITPKRKYYAMLGFMGGNMGMARNIRQKYNFIRKK